MTAELLRGKWAKLGLKDITPRVSRRRKWPVQVSVMGVSCVLWLEKTHTWV